MSGILSGVSGMSKSIGEGISMGLPSILGMFSDLLFPPPPQQVGPRLNDLTVMVSTYDNMISKIWGTYKGSGNVINMPKAGIKETKKTIGGGAFLGSGGGGMSQSTFSYFYTATLEIAFAEALLDAVPVLWGDTKIFYDARATPLSKIQKKYKKMDVVFRDGNEAQLPESFWEAEWGAGNVAAGRGVSTVFLKDLPLEDWGNRIPNLWGLLVRNARLSHIAVNMTNLNSGFKHIFTGSFVVDVDRMAAYYIGDDTSIPGSNQVTKFDLLDNKVVGDTSGQGWVGSSEAIDIDAFGFIYATYGGIATADVVKIDPLTMQIVAHTILWPGPAISGLAGITLHMDRVNNNLIWVTGRAIGSGQTGHAWMITHTAQPVGSSTTTTHPQLIGFNFIDPSVYGYPYIDQGGACVDGQGNLWYPGKGSQSIVRLSGGGGFTEYDVSALGNSPSVMFWDKKTDKIYFQIGAGDLYKFDPSSFSLEDTLTFPGMSIGRAMVKGVTTGKIWANADGPNNLIEIDLDFTGGTNLATSVNGTMAVLRGIDDDAGGNTVENNIYGKQAGNPVYLPLSHSLHINSGQIGGGGTGGVSNYYLDRIRPGAALLKNIVADINRHCGLLIDPFNTGASVDADVEELLDEVDGWGLTRVAVAAAALRQLADAYFFDAFNGDGKMRYVKRGKLPALTIPLRELAAHSADSETPEPIVITMPQPTDLPRVVKFNYQRRDFDWEQGMQPATVKLTEGTGEVSLEATVSGSDAWARQVAETFLHAVYVNAEQIEIALSNHYLKLDPTDVIEIEVPESNR